MGKFLRVNNFLIREKKNSLDFSLVQKREKFLGIIDIGLFYKLGIFWLDLQAFLLAYFSPLVSAQSKKSPIMPNFYLSDFFLLIAS